MDSAIRHVLRRVHKIRHPKWADLTRADASAGISTADLLAFYKDSAKENFDLVARNLKLLGLGHCVAEQKETPERRPQGKNAQEKKQQIRQEQVPVLVQDAVLKRGWAKELRVRIMSYMGQDTTGRLSKLELPISIPI